MEVSELISIIDIYDFISQYVELEQRGDEYWGISPFTFPPENTPSFSVRREESNFYDFSSGIGGNVFTFVRKYFECDNFKAAKILEEFAGVKSGGAIHKKMQALDVIKKFNPPRKNSKVSKSTVLPDTFMDKYEFDLDKLKIWNDEGVSIDSMNKFQVKYDGFSNRIVYPIRNPEGKIVNIGGRALDKDWKEKGQNKYCYFYPWGTMTTIYGYHENLNDIKDSREIILFEGCKSVLIANTWGINNCGALLTSHLNPNQAKLLIKLGCKVVFALDKDVNILTDHNINKLKQFVDVEYIYDFNNLLDQKDSPVDKGKEIFLKLYEERRRLT